MDDSTEFEKNVSKAKENGYYYRYDPKKTLDSDSNPGTKLEKVLLLFIILALIECLLHIPILSPILNFLGLIYFPVNSY